MGCLIAILAVITPRFAMLAIWFFSDWFDKAYLTTIWPLLGFFFAPYTSLAYMAAMLRNDGQVSGGWTVLLVIAIVADLSSSGNAGKKRSKHAKGTQGE